MLKDSEEFKAVLETVKQICVESDNFDDYLPGWDSMFDLVKGDDDYLFCQISRMIDAIYTIFGNEICCRNYTKNQIVGWKSTLAMCKESLEKLAPSLYVLIRIKNDGVSSKKVTEAVMACDADIAIALGVTSAEVARQF